MRTFSQSALQYAHQALFVSQPLFLSLNFLERFLTRRQVLHPAQDDIPFDNRQPVYDLESHGPATVNALPKGD